MSYPFHWAMLSDVLCAVLGVYFFSFSLSPLCFRRLIVRAHELNRAWRVHLADVFALMVTLQLAAGVVFLLTPVSEDNPAGLLRIQSLVFSWMVAAGWWIRNTRMLSRADIRPWRRRFIFLTCLTPLGYTAPLITVLSCALLIVHLLTWATEGLQAASLPMAAPTALAFGLSAAATIGARRYVDHLVKASVDRDSA